MTIFPAGSYVSTCISFGYAPVRAEMHSTSLLGDPINSMDRNPGVAKRMPRKNPTSIGENLLHNWLG